MAVSIADSFPAFLSAVYSLRQGSTTPWAGSLEVEATNACQKAGKPICDGDIDSSCAGMADNFWSVNCQAGYGFPAGVMRVR